MTFLSQKGTLCLPFIIKSTTCQQRATIHCRFAVIVCEIIIMQCTHGKLTKHNTLGVYEGTALLMKGIFFTIPTINAQIKKISIEPNVRYHILNVEISVNL